RERAARSCRDVRSSASPAARMTAARSSGGAMAAELHGQVVHARLLSRVGEPVAAVAGVIDAVADAQHVLDTVEREPQGAALHRQVLARARGVWGELAG